MACVHVATSALVVARCWLFIALDLSLDGGTAAVPEEEAPLPVDAAAALEGPASEMALAVRHAT